MPKKNNSSKKSKPPKEPAQNMEQSEEPGSKCSSISDTDPGSETSRQSSERNSLVEALISSPILTETRTKSQIRRQKRREKKLKKSLENPKIVQEFSIIPDVIWETVNEVNSEKCVAVISEDNFKITEIEVLDDLDRELLNSSPLMDEEEEKTLREFLRTLEIVDNQSRGTEEKRKSSFSDSDYEVIDYNKEVKTTIETIPEEIFEEFMVNEEMNKTKEAIKTLGVSKFSPKSSPKTKRKEPPKPPPKVVLETTPKTLYSYNGVPFNNPSKKSSVSIEDFEDGIVVINTIRERCPFKRLDVIMEESSDFSDASVHSEKKNESDVVIKTLIDRKDKIFDNGVKSFDFQIQPIIKETVKIFPLDQKIRDSVIIEEGIDSCSFDLVRTTALKVSDDVVKIELPESESEADVEVNQGKTQERQCEVEIVYLDDDSDVSVVGEETTPKVNEPNSTESRSSAKSRNYLTDLKFMEDESESWSSSGNNREECEDGTEADVESELDSRRGTFIFEGVDEDFDFEFKDVGDVGIKGVGIDIAFEKIVAASEDVKVTPESITSAKVDLTSANAQVPPEELDHTTDIIMEMPKVAETQRLVNESPLEVKERLEVRSTSQIEKEIEGSKEAGPAIKIIIETQELDVQIPINESSSSAKESVEGKSESQSNQEMVSSEEPNFASYLMRGIQDAAEFLKLANESPRSVQDAQEVKSDPPVQKTAHLTTEEVLSAVQLNLEKLTKSPNYSRQNSTSSCNSNSYNTAKYLPSYSRSGSEEDPYKKLFSPRNEEESSTQNRCQLLSGSTCEREVLDSLPKDDETLSEVYSPLAEDNLDLDTDFRNKNAKEEMDELLRKRNVKNLVESMGKNINEILMSKMKVIEYFEEPILSEATWSSMLEKTRKELETEERSKSPEFVKYMPLSSSSSYENIDPKNSEPLSDSAERKIPEPLSDLAERKILSLPYGWLILKKIGLCRCCSSNQDDKIEKKVTEAPINQHISRSNSGTSSEMRLYNLACWSGGTSPCSKTPDEEWHPLTPPPTPYVEFRCITPQTNLSDRWYGMQTNNPSLVVGLSPSQKKVFEERDKRPTRDEAANLLDLHQKFLERRSYHEVTPYSKERSVVFDSKVMMNNIPKTDDRYDQPLCKIGIDSKNTKAVEMSHDKQGKEETKVKNDGVIEEERKAETSRKFEKSGNGRVLASSQNATSDDFVPELNTNSSIGSSFESHEVSLVQNQAAMFEIWQKQRKFGPSSKNGEEVFKVKNTNGLTENGNENVDPKQDQHKFLNEFRKVTKSTAGDEEEVIITKNLPPISDVIKAFEEPKIEKPKKEHQNLEEQIQFIMNEKYRISKKGDIAVIQNGDDCKRERRKSLLSDEEIFKQRMYEEYMSKLAERYERRQQKVIRMSQANEIDSPDESKFQDIENEFINKVKERNGKLGLNPENGVPNLMFESFERKCQEFTNFWEGLDAKKNFGSKEESSRGKEESPETTSSKRSSIQLIIDPTSDVANLPKHLQEFLQVEDEAWLPDVKNDLRLERKEKKAKILDNCSKCKQPKVNLLKEIDEALVLGKGFLLGKGSAMLAPTFKATAPRPGVWSPAQPTPTEEKQETQEENEERKKLENEPIPPVWTPKSAQASPVAERKEFRPVTFESPTLPRKKYIQEEKTGSPVLPPWQQGDDRPPESLRTPGSPGLSLPRAPNPTVTLLQKAREGHLPRGAHYLNHNMSDICTDGDRTVLPNEVLYTIKDDSERPRKIELGPRKYTGIGPTTKEGIPIVLRSEVADEENRERWYKRMYNSLHRAGKDEDYVTVKYRTSPSRKDYGYQKGVSSGYQSEPEAFAYDSNQTVNKYQTLDRRRSERNKENDYISVTLPRSRASTPRYGSDIYRNQPGRIEDYEPGRSSISELEAKQWWDEVLEIFDRWLERNPDAQGPGARKLLTDAIERRRQEERSQPVHKTESPKSFMTYALKESGYLSDPQHVYKRREDDYQSSLSPQEQREAYRVIQKGGEVPLRGLRKPAPERPKDDTEIEYFPLSPTLTRIRVHKQNITPLSEFPFLTFPVSYQHTTFNYPNLPLGVCSSYSQVQIFPPPPPPPAIEETSKQSKKKKAPETVYTKKGSRYSFTRSQDSVKKEQKFSVQLQNISGPEDYIQIVPQPRSAPKKVHEYVNLPVRSRSCSPGYQTPKREISPLSFCSETCSSSYRRTFSPTCDKGIPRYIPDQLIDSPVFPSQGNISGSLLIPEQKKSELATFSDLKRIAPSIVEKIADNNVRGKVIHSKPKQRKVELSDKPKRVVQKKSSLIPQRTAQVVPEKVVKKQPIKKTADKAVKKNLTDKTKNSADRKIGSKTSKPKTKVPLSESSQREKPLLKTTKRLRTAESVKKQEAQVKKLTKSVKKDTSDSEKSSTERSKQDILDYLSRFVESQLGSGYIELQSSEEGNTESCTVEESGKETDVAMNPIYDSVNPNFGVKRKIESNITEAFRSRSFSPDVRKKVSKPPDKLIPPDPPKRKSSKNNSTLRMWSKMMVSYPYHRSRLDTFDSNVKFLRDRLKRKLDRGLHDKENESEFGDDIETVRTIRKDKNGAMSIKTDRYVKISRPISSSPATPTRLYDVHGRRVTSEPRTKSNTPELTKARKLSDASTVSKSTDQDVKNKKKGLDTVVRSSTTYSVRNGVNQEEDKRKSVKVTVAISSKGKEVLRKSASLSSATKKSPLLTKGSSSPSPSISSYRSGISGRSLLSEKESTISSPGRGTSPQSRLLSPNSSGSRISSPTRSPSPGSTVTSDKQKPLKSRVECKTTGKKLIPVQSSATPITVTFNKKPEKKTTVKKVKEAVKTSTITKSPGRRLLAQMSSLAKSNGSKEDLKKKIKKNGKSDGVLEKKLKKNGNGKIKNGNDKKKKSEKKSDKEVKNEVIEGSNLVRTDSFFQNLFLRGPPDKKPTANVERTSSVLERARKYQRSIERPAVHKSEPSLALITFYLTQKKPVSLSKFKSYDRELSSSRSPSPYTGSRSQSFQMKLRRFDSGSQFGEEGFSSISPRELSPDVKGRSLSEPPVNRSQSNSPDDKLTRISVSEASSIRTSPTPSRSPSCRRIQTLKAIESGRDLRKKCVRARSAGEVDELRPSYIGAGSSLAQSTSSLNLSNLSDHAEYQAYVLELMHSTKKCERFRELHKFYSSLERMGELEKTASVGDLRPRMKNEEIIDYDRWKKLRTKERAEAELKMLVGKLTEIQKEKDLIFTTADVEAVRWKGDRGLRIKEHSVEDLKEQFIKYAQEESSKKKELATNKDNYKPLWRGSSIVNLATSLNTTMASHRGRPVTLDELKKIEAAKEKIAKKLGTKGISSRAWSSLSSEQVNALKNQLSEIYTQELKKKGFDVNLSGITENYEITVPEDSDLKSPGEKSLYVRCNSLLSKDQMYSPSVTRKDEFRQETKKAESISSLPNWKSDDRKVGLLELPWKDEAEDQAFTRTQSEVRSKPKSDSSTLSEAVKRKPLSENEKKRLSMTLSKEVLEKATKAPGKTPVLPRETLGALAVEKLKKSSPGSPRTCYSLEDGKSKNDFLLVLTPTEKGKDVEKVVEEWANGNVSRSDRIEQSKTASTAELESASASSETSIKTVIRKNSVDVLKKVEYFEDLGPPEEEAAKSIKKSKSGSEISGVKKKKGKISLAASHSLENLKDILGQERKYATVPLQRKTEEKPRPEKEFQNLKKIFEDHKWSASALRYHSASPSGYRSIPSVSSTDSIFSFRSRSVSPDPTKYYRAYLRMVKCGAVRKLCNKFESWENLSCFSDRDGWLAPPKKFASDPELTRDMLRRYGTDPTKVTIRGQEVGNVRWLRTKYEKDPDNPKKYRFRRVGSPLSKSPLGDRFMPRINVISKTAELQLQRLSSDSYKKLTEEKPNPRLHELAASPEPYRSLIDYTKEHGGYYYTGEVEKLRRKFERLHEAERLSILGQMYTSTPEVNELRDIAPYLGCSWVAHRYPGVVKTSSSPELSKRCVEITKKVKTKPRPHSSSPIRPKQPSSILKPSYPAKDIFANQKYDPSIHRPRYRYQPDVDLDRRSKRKDTDSWWRLWNKPTVKFKEPVGFSRDPKLRDSTPDSSRKYVESEVTIHYKSPVRSEAKAYLSEEELARRQAESMKRIYQEERRRKYLQELQDMNSRRHTDNFIPSQKSPIPLNRYDDFPYDHRLSSPTRSRETSEPILVARGLYDFAGRRPRELAFRRGDIIFMIRRLDKNWCEGELNGSVGLFPLSYVEIIPYDDVNPKYGRARAKYDFVPQTSIELPARKGDMITLIRRIDDNWFEGRIGNKTGIIPASYCHIFALPQSTNILPVRQEKSKPVAAPAAHSLIHNGKMPTRHSYNPWYHSGPTSPGPSTASSISNYPDGYTNISHHHRYNEFQPSEDDFHADNKTSATQPLKIRINPRPEPALYQVLFNHVPNNDDELELVQGDTVLVVEKCEDGWYVGTNPLTGKIGIFPGTHVRRMSPEFV